MMGERAQRFSDAREHAALRLANLVLATNAPHLVASVFHVQLRRQPALLCGVIRQLQQRFCQGIEVAMP